MQSHPQYTSAHPVHNMDRMLALLSPSWFPVWQKVHNRLGGIAICRHRLASEPELTPESLVCPAATFVVLRKKRASDSPDPFKRHELSGRSVDAAKGPKWTSTAP